MIEQIIIYPDYTMLFCPLRRHSVQNIEKNQNLKAKDTETRKTKTQKVENLVLPKEQANRKCRLI